MRISGLLRGLPPRVGREVILDFNDPYTTKAYLERRVRDLDPGWDRQSLLEARGVFLLTQVTRALDISPAGFKKQAFDLDGAKGHAWIQLGLALCDDVWYVNMEPFAKHYRLKTHGQIREVRASWDTNQMLAQTGVFFLADVVKKLPFTLRQVRRHAYQHPNPKAAFGMWKNEDMDFYLVDMEVFSAWISRVWRCETPSE